MEDDRIHGRVLNWHKKILSGYAYRKDTTDPVSLEIYGDEIHLGTVTADKFYRIAKERSIHPTGQCYWKFDAKSLDVTQYQKMSARCFRTGELLGAQRIDIHREIFFYQHIPKTGGTSIRSHLEGALPEGALWPSSKVLKEKFNGKYPTGQEIEDHHDEWIDESVKIVFAHVNYNTIRRLPLDYKIITTLREPVERSISHLNHFIKHRNDVNEEALIDGEFSPEIVAAISNLQHRMMNIVEHEMYDEIASRYDFIGFFTDIQRCTDYILNRLGIRASSIGHLNKSVYKLNQSDRLDSIKSYLLQINQKDLNLTDGIRQIHSITL